ncbi:preprotein translocase subunit SecG [Flexibacterium corallicola]|uniref:preprotein translocase subunit SecG n=1 Tax=Flexibacterium corallicola TaxID=3037259 RepID=UPI00286F738E|nr:preprotein translocase subunit SecG [Pseudovibrio sp. M1P-2-3]
METVLIVIHLMVVLALVALVLLQRSEGGALGMGGGGGSGGGFMTSRGTANVLTRGTAILAAVFFITSLSLALISRWDERPGSLLDNVPTAVQSEQTQDTGRGLLEQLQGNSQQQAPAQPSGPQVPAAQ